MKRLFSLQAKVYLFGALVTLTSVFFVGLFMYHAQVAEVQGILGKLLVNIARTGALFVDGDAHDRILGNLQAEGPEYRSAQTLLDRIRVENNLPEDAIYTCRRLNESTMEFVVSVGKPRVGEYYDPPPEPRAHIAALYASGQAQFTAPYRSGDRSVISAIAPVKNRKGTVVGYLEIDYPEEAVTRNLRARLLPLAKGLLLGALLAFIISVVLSFGITAPIRKVLVLVRAVAQGGGDLTQRIRIASRDVVGDLAAAINDFIALLEGLIRRVIVSAQAIATFSKKVLSISEGQVQAASEQASAVHETTRTITELVRTFQDTSERSALVAQEAQSAFQVAEEGLGRLKETVTEMDRVKTTSVETIQEIYGLVERSHEIGQVMNLINDVAAKTKLIAFNAAIEASAAGGEAGRRFSVVAQEVRRLAERVVKSTGEIEGIIKDIQGRVEKLILKTEENYRKIERGFQAAEDARLAIERIVSGVERTSQAASEIETTTRQQKIAGDQIVMSLSDIERTTRDFKDSILEMKSAVDALDRLFVDLLAHIRNFRVGESTA